MEVDVTERTCTVDDCEQPTRSGKATLCKKHYHRWYRHGSVDANANTAGVSVSLGRRYRRVYVGIHHPLASPTGSAWEHRSVLFDKIGDGNHPCHWCGTELDWFLDRRNPAALQVDHLNSIGDDNRPENLVPSCRNCNVARGAQARADALRAAGFWSKHDTIARLSNGGRRDRVA